MNKTDKNITFGILIMSLGIIMMAISVLLRLAS